LLVIALAAIVYAFAFRGPAANEKSRLQPVVINQAFEHLLYLGLYVAKDKGLFEKEGLDVRIDTGGGDDKAFAALASGSAQFAQGDPAFVAIARQRGWDGRVIAMAVDRVAIWGLAKDPAIKPFTDPSGFRGRRVATYPNPNTAYVVQRELLQRAGLREGRDSQIVQVAFGSELAALQRGQVDIAQTIEPNVSAHEVAGGTVAFSYPEAWGPLAFTGVMTSQKFIEQQPQTVQAFLNAYEKALVYIHENRAGALEVAQRRLPDIPQATLERALNRLIASGSFPAHAAVDPASWRSLLEVRVKVGDLPSVPRETLFDNRFAQKAATSPSSR
jgi:NitT/TauT family transport system substrate-binding protein